MFSYSRTVLLLVLSSTASLGLQAQSSSTSAQPEQPPTQATAPTPTQSSMSVQARIRARREQRRAAAINDVYSHLYEVYFGSGFLRTTPGPSLQRLNEYDWNVGFTRYFNQKLGVTVDGRGNYGTAFVGLPQVSSGTHTNPAISQYDVMIGPTYRFILQPRYSISGRVLAGGAFGNFSSDIRPYTPAQIGLYPDGSALALSASVPIEYNVSPGLGLRIAPEYMLTNFGSTIQSGYGLTGGVVIRFGKQ